MNTGGSLTDPSQHAFWLASRAVGIVALILLSLSVAIGLSLSGRMTSRPGGVARLKTLHEAITLTALLAIASHGALLLGDPYLNPGITGVTLPFALKSQPVWTGIGILGGWLAVILGLSYYARRWIGIAAWRWMHRWTLLAYVLSIGHVVGSGSDSGSAWFLVLLAATTAPVVAIGLRRLERPGHPRPGAVAR